MNARLGANANGGGGDNAQRTAEDQRAPPPQQIGGHAAGDLTQQADAVENALGQADLRQRKAAGRQQRDPDGVGEAQGRGKCVQIHAAKLFL